MTANEERQDATFEVRAIGFVRREGGTTLVEILPGFRPGLAGLEGFSHAQVLWWCDRLDGDIHRGTLQFDPPFRAPRLGVFSAKAPMRPNPIGLSVVRIMAVDHDAGLIRTPAMDALDGTPILDLKPYVPWYDRVEAPYVPEWAAQWPAAMPENGIDVDQTPR